MEFSKDFIRSRLLKIKDILERALIIASTNEQKNRIKEQLFVVKADLEKLDQDKLTDTDIAKYRFTKDEEEVFRQEVYKEVSFDILETIPQISPSPYINDKELILINSYLCFFEKEYLPLFSTRYLKVDFSHQAVLDSFYAKFRRIQLMANKFFELIENVESSENERYTAEMQKLKRKRYRELLFNIDGFFSELQSFLELILENPTSEGILTEPNFLIEFENEETKIVNNIEAIEAVKDMYKFVLEVKQFIGLSG